MQKSFTIVALLFIWPFFFNDAKAQEFPPVSDLIAPFVKEGKFSAFAFNADPTDPKKPGIKYELQAIDLMAGNGKPKVSFVIEYLKSGQPGYFKAKYRVLYLTKPLTASATGGINPYSKFPGAPTSTVYALGVLDTAQSGTPPKMTAWLSLEDIQLTFE